jgi:hypothetical protein
VTVRFDPDSEGSKSATLGVQAGAQPLNIALSGTATAPGQVDFRRPKKPLVKRGSSLDLGPLRCEALQNCAVSVRASIIARVRIGKWTRRRTTALNPLELSLTAQGTHSLRLHLTRAARQLLARDVGHVRLQVHLRLSAGGQPESRSLGLRIRS